jgi:hypothetical protein
MLKILLRYRIVNSYSIQIILNYKIMRKFFKYNILGLTLLLLSMVSCDTADQDTSPIASPDGYPVATFTTNISGTTLTEGDTLIYTITMDKMIERTITFDAHFIGGTASEEDFVITKAIMQPYSTVTELMIVFNDDGIPSATSKTAEFEIGVFGGVAERYLLNPSQTFPTTSITVNNFNDPTLLTIALSWEVDEDIDMVTFSALEGEWGDGGATAANPEIDHSIWLADPVGTYYVNIMDWGVDPFDYTFTIGHPDGSVQVITGTFDNTGSTYTVDNWTKWAGGPYESYRVLKVENDGSKFTVTKL